MNHPPALASRRVRVPENVAGKPPEVAEYPAGTVIFSEGSPGYRAFIVQSGLVEISKIGANGERVIGYVGGGEVFGEMAPIDRSPRMASATAVKDTTCIVMREDMLSAKLAEADPFVRDLLFVLVRGLRQVTEEMLDR